MKLGQMETEKAMDVIAQITDPVCNIMEDKKVVAKIREMGEKAAKSGDVTMLEKAAAVVRALVPVAMKDHKEDLFFILHVMTEKDVEEIRKQSFKATLKDAGDILDQDLLDFFGSHAQ